MERDPTETRTDYFSYESFVRVVNNAHELQLEACRLLGLPVPKMKRGELAARKEGGLMGTYSGIRLRQESRFEPTSIESIVESLKGDIRDYVLNAVASEPDMGWERFSGEVEALIETIWTELALSDETPLAM